VGAVMVKDSCFGEVSVSLKLGAIDSSRRWTASLCAGVNVLTVHLCTGSAGLVAARALARYQRADGGLWANDLQCQAPAVRILSGK